MRSILSTEGAYAHFASEIVFRRRCGVHCEKVEQRRRIAAECRIVGNHVAIVLDFDLGVLWRSGRVNSFRCSVAGDLFFELERVFRVRSGRRVGERGHGHSYESLFHVCHR